MSPIEQQFFNDLEKKLWTAADKLRSNLDAAVYKHVVLGLIFLKYVSDEPPPILRRPVGLSQASAA
jgi:type I restriction enzyme M protein